MAGSKRCKAQTGTTVGSMCSEQSGGLTKVAGIFGPTGKRLFILGLSAEQPVFDSPAEACMFNKREVAKDWAKKFQPSR